MKILRGLQIIQEWDYGDDSLHIVWREGWNCKGVSLYKSLSVYCSGLDLQRTWLAWPCTNLWFLNHCVMLPIGWLSSEEKRYLTPSIQWLMYVAKRKNTEVCHEFWGSEYKVGACFLDSYVVIHRLQLLNVIGNFPRAGLDGTMKITGTLWQRPPSRICISQHNKIWTT